MTYPLIKNFIVFALYWIAVAFLLIIKSEPLGAGYARVRHWATPTATL